LGAHQENDFRCRVDGPIPAVVKLDGRRLQQILLNLISNAAKFTRRGTIELLVSASKIGVTTILRFAVTDSGVGIEPAAQPSVFNAFKQLDIRPGSAGLGLFIAQRIVENMGGKLMLESTPGIGSRFSFQITTT